MLCDYVPRFPASVTRNNFYTQMQKEKLHIVFHAHSSVILQISFFLFFFFLIHGMSIDYLILRKLVGIHNSY